MTALEQAEKLRQEAISLLVAEKQSIDEKLTMLGYEAGIPVPRKTRTCSKCGATEHSARNCPFNEPEPTA